MRQPVVSIIVRAKNEEKLLPECLKRVYWQDLKDFEVVFVDSGSTDGTLNIIRQFQYMYNNIQIVEIRPQDFTYGYALNMGCSHAIGEYCVSLSAHALPKTNRWLSTIIKYFENELVAGVGGWSKEVFIQTSDTFKMNPYYGFDNGNAAFRKDLWEEYHFREDMMGTEDKEWEFYFLEKGFITIYDPEADVIHDHKETLKQVYIRSYREHHGFAQFLDRTVTERMLRKKLNIFIKMKCIKDFIVYIGAYKGLRDRYKVKNLK